MFLPRTVERVGKNHEILVLRINLSTNTVPTDPYVMIKVLVLEGQLRHISRHLVQSSNNTKQWFDTRLLQLIQEKWQCWNSLFSTSTVYTMSNIVCPESCTENQFTFVAGSQYFSEVSTWLISHRVQIIEARPFHWKRHQSGGWWPACRRVKLNLCQSWCHANIIPWVGKHIKQFWE